MNIINRLRSFSDRADWLGGLMPSKLQAMTYMLQSRGNQSLEGHGRYQGYGFTFRGRDLSSLKEVFVDQEYAFLDEYLKQLDAPYILDIGAHIGTFALCCFQANPQSQVLSLEADSDTFKVLKKNRTQNPALDAQWHILNRAAWHADEQITFQQHETSSMSNRVSEQGTVSVEGISPQALLAECRKDQIDLMKIDIEGAEEAFLCAAPDMLDKVSRLIIELHPNLCDTDKVENLLQDKFSKIENIAGRTSNKPLLDCTR